MSTFQGENLSCIRGGRVVFARLGFALRPGGALVLSGPNGSGKSSLLRLMAGLTPALSGRLVWNGEPVADDPAAHRKRLHYVGHLDAIKPALSARETLVIAAAMRGGEGRLADAAMEALAAMGIARLGDVPVRYFSAGQRRRLALARLFASPAPLWLLDEPRTALDAHAMAALDEAIARHRSGGGMIVAALHGGAHPDGADVLDLAAFSAVVSAPSAGPVA
ncbi:MAG: cytochrome c biogenesis heme-transporting ATPase CcmA [Rhodospirillales bacterium]|jgi:heme exporter protein A|nr:cytochrome c biogenesis heme-transporting ATPase CcmA [Rhodospirillales bacterium]